MAVINVLTCRELRAALADTIRRVQRPDAGPIFVGAHRKPEAVMLSVAHYESLVEAARRRAVVAESLASVRAEGLEPGPSGLRRLEAIADGRMTTDQARDEVLGQHTG